MNKQEAIELLQEIAQRVFYRRGTRSVYIDKIVEVVNQIDEPQKPVIPKFVAEWIEETKRVYNLYGAMGRIKDNLAPSEILKWFDTNPRLTGEILARAWLNGYTVEQEKLYTVEIPNPNLNAHVVLQKTGDGLVLVTVGNAGWAEWESSKLTESEIKKDFEWAFQFAKEVEE